jgi:hypothetical protein
MPLPDPSHRVRLEGVDFARAFPALRLFDAFRMALQPTKLLLGLFMLLLIYFLGVTLDFIWGPQTVGDLGGYEYFVFQRTFEQMLSAFRYLIESAVSLNLGLDAIAGDRFGAAAEPGVVGALLTMIIGIPSQLWNDHPWFFLLLVGSSLVIKLFLGTAIARLAATQACFDRSVGLFETMQFTWPRAPWTVICPLIPLVIAGVFWLVLAIAGAALFNLPGLNVVGGLGFGLMLLVGFAAACLLIFTALGAGMMPSALAVEGTDAFDVVSRVFNFIMNRPAKYLLLTAVIVIYGALTYLVVGLVLFLTLWFTRAAAGVWASDLATMMPPPQLGEPAPTLRLDDTVGDTVVATTWLIRVWSALLFGLSIAYAISYFFTAQTWLYLLLRRDVDGTDFAEAHPEPGPETRLEPNPATAPTPGTAPAPGSADSDAPPADPDQTVDDAPA